jgi:hypothetical protein
LREHQDRLRRRDGPYCQGGANAFVGERDVAPVFVQREVQAAMHLRDDGIHQPRHRYFLGVAAGQHHRNARLIDQDRIRLVDHGRVEGAVNLLPGTQSDLVAQRIEPDLIGGGVGDVAGVGRAPLGH